jgi:hypothetical protein
MATFLRSARSILEPICSHSLRFKGALAALLFVLPVLCMHASAQTTTISGTVYDPRTTANSLPLPNVLVYATTGTPAALTPGVQCLTSTSSAPTDPNVVSYTNTAVDGTFTLTDVPVNATYTLVIQAGKWRRQFSETVAASSLTGLALHMPSDHTQGDIPLIAIATGEADGLECVFHLMGIADGIYRRQRHRKSRRAHPSLQGQRIAWSGHQFVDPIRNRLNGFCIKFSALEQL